jgi:3-deoxy-manno-octulosonate cytidylyltransferase (CMP-KDO synthetase)
MSSGEPQHHVVAVIPARFQSSRFPGKPLHPIAGIPMIAHVVRRVRQARRVAAVWVATDDERIAGVARGEGAEVAMTSPGHRSGTDRVAEAVRSLAAEVVINVQGDEPLVDPLSLDRLAAALADGRFGVATLACPIRSVGEWRRRDVVKVVLGEDGQALYFSRAPIPVDRADPSRPPRAARRHLGIYAFRREVLLRFAAGEPTPLERLEGLEQLRLLERGERIQVLSTSSEGVAVDRPADVRRVERELRRRARAGRAAAAPAREGNGGDGE